MTLLARVANRFVVHADMLGMREVALQNPELAFAALSKLNGTKEEILSWGIEVTSSGVTIRDRIDHFSFSDSVIVVSRSDTQEDLYAIVLLCAEFFYRALSNGIPLRAGMAHGILVTDPDMKIIVGPALVEAVRLGEGAQWLGVVLDPFIADGARALPLESDRGRPLVVEYELPFKSGETRLASVIDWVEPHRAHFKSPLPWSAEELHSQFGKLSGLFHDLPSEVKRKYENTTRFMNRPRP